VALYEVMPIKDEIKELILQGASVMDIKKTAVAVGLQTLRMSGLAKIREGMTTLDEVLETTFPTRLRKYFFGGAPGSSDRRLAGFDY